MQKTEDSTLQPSPLISVIIPVYNASGTLARCLASVTGQTYSRLEIIVVNDGSRDDSGLLCRQWAERDARIVYVEKQNGGVSSARNLGLERARGEWVTFVDADDWAESTMVEEMLKMAQQVPDCELAICTSVNEYPNGTTGHKTQSPAIVTKRQLTSYPLCALASEAACYYDRISLGASLGAAWGQFASMGIIKRLGLQFSTELRTAEDHLFFLQVQLAAHNFVVFDRPLYHYCIVSGSAMNGVHPEVVEETRRCDRLFRAVAERIPTTYRAVYLQYLPYRNYGRMAHHWALSPYSTSSPWQQYRDLRYVLQQPECHIAGGVSPFLSCAHRLEMWAVKHKLVLLLMVLGQIRKKRTQYRSCRTVVGQAKAY